VRRKGVKGTVYILDDLIKPGNRTSSAMTY
jgi:hypothetical protein